MRGVRSAALCRNIPVHGHCGTTSSTLTLESGLELELMLSLDRLPDVVWLVPQPCRLEWSGGPKHTPDLLSVRCDGGYKLWDARPKDRQKPDFAEVAALTDEACRRIGWSYEVFEGLPAVESLNLRWLSGARRAPEWLEPGRVRLRDLVGDGATIGDVAGTNDPGGHLLSVLWHLLWTGEVRVDLGARWDASTLMSWSKSA